jgi:ABC-2 type transport system ATP-binding protein
MALTADRLVIIGRGRLIAETDVTGLLAAGTDNYVRVRSGTADALAVLLTERGATVTSEPDGALRVTGVTADEIGELARLRGLGLLELSQQRMSLEQRYMELTRDATDYQAGLPADPPGADHVRTLTTN